MYMLLVGSDNYFGQPSLIIDMSELYTDLKPQSNYYDRKNYNSLEEYREALKTTSTVYVGNLSFFTTQDSIAELFSRAGPVKEIIMGIDNEGHPCGFCFVVYEKRQDAGYAVQYVSRTRLNDRVIRVDWDPGYKQGREKGRGTGGQQRRDDFRTREDADRPKKRNTYEGRDRDNRERTSDYRRNDRGERGDRYDRGDRGDRYDRGDRGDRYDRGERGDRSDRYDRGDRNERRYDRGDRQRGDREDRNREGDRAEGGKKEMAEPDY